jgi:hypothetical protein
LYVCSCSRNSEGGKSVRPLCKLDEAVVCFFMRSFLGSHIYEMEHGRIMRLEDKRIAGIRGRESSA